MDEKMCEIHDPRSVSDFKGKTFSDFKQTEVKQELLNSFIESKIEPACYWSAEMICSGHFSELWEIIVLFYSKYIHLANVNIALYIERRLNQFKQIVNTGYVEDELPLRNHDKIRSIFMELVTILCLTKRKYTVTHAVLKDNDFNMSHMSEKMHASHLHFGREVFLEDDPQEMYIAINELAYNVSLPIRNAIGASYWIEWGIEFDRRCKRRREKCECQRRENVNVDSVFQTHSIWLIWNVLVAESYKRTVYIQKVISALLSTFCLRFKNSVPVRRKYIIHFVVTLLCENEVAPTNEILEDKYKELVSTVLMKKNVIYHQIKRNEKTDPNNELLSTAETSVVPAVSSNLKETLRKLEILNGF
jgi:hypothetical protein